MRGRGGSARFVRQETRQREDPCQCGRVFRNERREGLCGVMGQSVCRDRRTWLERRSRTGASASLPLSRDSLAPVQGADAQDGLPWERGTETGRSLRQLWESAARAPLRRAATQPPLPCSEGRRESAYRLEGVLASALTGGAPRPSVRRASTRGASLDPPRLCVSPAPGGGGFGAQSANPCTTRLGTVPGSSFQVPGPFSPCGRWFPSGGDTQNPC